MTTMYLVTSASQRKLHVGNCRVFMDFETAVNYCYTLARKLFPENIFTGKEILRFVQCMRIYEFEPGEPLKLIKKERIEALFSSILTPVSS